ncbi:MAG: cyclic nucleotide-binding domain-containing protein, partial [bacterium]|nr:cyclic nucleotide-binding domain-containing protein [bacterium]
MSFNGSTITDLVKNLHTIPFFDTLASARLLKSIDFFSSMEEELLEELAPTILLTEFERDSIVCRHGKFDERFYIILSGSARAVIPTEENPRYELYRLGKGDFFGEEIVVSLEPRANSIIACDKLVTLSMTANTLVKLMDVSASVKSLMDKQYIERKLRRDLRSVPVFNHLDVGLFEEVLKKVELVTIAEKQEIFKQGDVGDTFFLIRNGEVNVYRKQDGEDHLIAILAEGQFFGEMSLLLHEPRNASIETTKETSLVKISSSNFLDIVGKDKRMTDELQDVVVQRREHSGDALKHPETAITTRKLLDLNKEVNKHLDIISQCTIDTDHGSALLASLPGSRYPYVYPRDSACASRFLYKLIISPLKSGELAFRLLGEIARFILSCQREDGYWGQRYGINGQDKGIYKQEDNVAHGVSILCRYLLAAKKKGIRIAGQESMLDAIEKGSEFARTNYYRNEIHLFYSTTSIHESAIEEGYSIWVNYAYLMMLRLIERVSVEYDAADRFKEEMELKSGFELTIDNVFSHSDRYVRRLKPDGVVDLRPDITLLSPFFFCTGMEEEYFKNGELFQRSIGYVEDTLWDPDFGMLQRYLPFIEDPDTHIHAGNGPWIQYTAMLAQYYFYNGNLEKGNEILKTIDSYMSPEGYL